MLMRDATDDEGEAGADLMGTVFAVRALIKDGRGGFFASCCVGAGASGVAGAGEEGGLGRGTSALVGSGAVFWASPFTNAARDTFFVPCCVGTSGEVVIVE